MNKRAMGLWMAAVAGAAMTVPAQAAVITRNFQVSAVFPQATAPVRSVVLDFLLTYDPVVAYNGVAVTGYVSSSAAASFNPASVLFYTFPGGGGGNILQFSGAMNGGSVIERSNDFLVILVTDAAGNVIASPNTTVEYSLVGSSVNFNTRNVATVVTTPGNGAVPEPATWAMLLVGFGAIGAAARYRRRGVAFG